MSMTLVIGTRKWSSWSLRPWIALKQAGLPFQEVTIALRQPDTKARILEYSPSGKIPVLIDGAVVVWESLAILDHLADRFPTRGLWPAEPVARGHARAISSEMHAGFAALRRELGMDVSAELPAPDLTPDAKADVARIQTIWREARQRFGGAGPFLFGRFTNADAMFAPVATRFRTYGIELDPVCRDYADAVLNLPSMIAWYRLAEAEPE
jgi:glutathione S-transferase